MGPEVSLQNKMLIMNYKTPSQIIHHGPRCMTVLLFGSEMSRAKNELQRTPTFMDLYHEMEAVFVRPPAGIRLHS